MSQDQWNHQYYASHSGPQEEGALDALSQYVFQGNESVLDIGCGDGKITKNIASQIPKGKVIGIDASENMIEGCREKYKECENMHFELANATNFHCDQQFDLIVSFYVLHYVEDHTELVQKIYRWLKPDGRLIIRMSGGGHPDILEVFFREPWRTLILPKDIKWYAKNEEEYTALLKQAGFNKFKAEVQNHSASFTKESLFCWLNAWIPYATGLSKDKAIIFSQEIMENIIKNQEDPSEIKLSGPILCVEAYK